jgi:tRNA(Met) C34 N-acetyltransferase TmcA
VFARLLGRAAGLMKDAAVDMEQRARTPLHDPKTGLDVPAAQAVDQETQRLMREALNLLEQMLEALKPENAVARKPQKQQQKPENPMAQDSPKGQGDGIPYLAQLKALKSLQEDINRRTTAFGRKHPDTAKLNPKEQQELESLRQEQEELKDLLQELTAPAAAEPEGGKP